MGCPENICGSLFGNSIWKVRKDFPETLCKLLRSSYWPPLYRCSFINQALSRVCDFLWLNQNFPWGCGWSMWALQEKGKYLKKKKKSSSLRRTWKMRTGEATQCRGNQIFRSLLALNWMVPFTCLSSIFWSQLGSNEDDSYLWRGESCHQRGKQNERGMILRRWINHERLQSRVLKSRVQESDFLICCYQLWDNGYMISVSKSLNFPDLFNETNSTGLGVVVKINRDISLAFLSLAFLMDVQKKWPFY